MKTLRAVAKKLIESPVKLKLVSAFGAKRVFLCSQGAGDFLFLSL